MENKNKVATVRKEGVSDSGKPTEAINEAKGMDANGGVWKWIKSLFKTNDSGCTFLLDDHQEKKSALSNTKRQRLSLPVLPMFGLFGSIPDSDSYDDDDDSLLY